LKTNKQIAPHKSARELSCAGSDGFVNETESRVIETIGYK